MRKNKILSILVVGMLVMSACGAVQATKGNEKNKDGKEHPNKAVFEVEHMTIQNWSFYVGPDDNPDRTVYVDPVSISDKTVHVNANKWIHGGGLSAIAAMPAKKQAMAQAKQGIDRKKGETVRICIKSIEVKNLKVVAKLPEKMPTDMQSMSSEQSMPSAGPQLPSYQVTIHRMNIKKWSFLIGPGDTAQKTMSIGDVTLEDRTIPVGPSAKDDKRSMAAMQSVREQVKQGMMKKNAMQGKTYRVVIQNIHLHDVKLVAGNSDEMNDTTSQTTQTTTTDEMTTTTEQGMTTTTADSSENSGSGSDETTDSSGQPGFGIPLAIIALLGAALLATRRQ